MDRAVHCKVGRCSTILYVPVDFESGTASHTTGSRVNPLTVQYAAVPAYLNCPCILRSGCQPEKPRQVRRNER